MVQSLAWRPRCCSLGHYMPLFFKPLNPAVRRSCWILFIQSQLLFVSLLLLSIRQCLGLSLWPLLKRFYNRNFVIMSNVALFMLLSESLLVPSNQHQGVITDGERVISWREENALRLCGMCGKVILVLLETSRVQARWDLRSCGNATLVFLSLYQQLNNNNSWKTSRPRKIRIVALLMCKRNPSLWENQIRPVVCKWGNPLGKNSSYSCFGHQGNSNRKKLSLGGNCN